MTSKEIGYIINQHRKKSGLTQKELADLSSVGKTVVFDIEKGKETVQLNSLLKILNVLNIKIELVSPLINSELNEKG
ncbi:MAG TPA: type II toxin-antitoxin system Y4mF family antitoxin [Ignavibacteriaceae bacterium]|nr:type II toxin-antitoxin system Y4mF family antitoxin [Ignavibacteriaceae bacterium]